MDAVSQIIFMSLAWLLYIVARLAVEGSECPYFSAFDEIRRRSGYILQFNRRMENKESVDYFCFSEA